MPSLFANANIHRCKLNIRDTNAYCFELYCVLLKAPALLLLLFFVFSVNGLTVIGFQLNDVIVFEILKSILFSTKILLWYMDMNHAVFWKEM